MQHAEHHVDLGAGVFVRLLQFPRKQHAGCDVADGAQHVLDALAAHDAVEVELQVAGVATAVAVVQRDLELAERIDALHQALVGAVAPQKLDVLHRRTERGGGHESREQLLEGQAREILAAEHTCQGVGPHGADLVVRIEQEEALVHRFQNVASLLLRFPCCLFMA